MKPIIAITAGAVPNKTEPWSPVTHGQSYTYIEAILRADGVPFIVPIIDDGTTLKQLYNLADGILFAGGNDVNPQLYNEAPYPSVTDVSPVRDGVETKLMQWALTDHKPLLGICRGMQLLNIIQGGTCYQDITADLPKASDHNRSTKRKDLEDIAHNLHLNPDSQLAKIIDSPTIGANTHHHQAIKKLGKKLRVNCRSEDDLIEGIEVTDQGFALGVQSHPESLDERAEIKWRKLFTSFVQASQYSSQTYLQR